MTKILFVYQFPMPFVMRDLKIVRDSFETKVIKWPKLRHKPFSTTINLFKGIKQTDAVFCWFASYHALVSVFFAKLLKKKSIIVTGGYDVVSIPEINYGVFRSPFKGRIVKWTLENADLVIPFSQYAEDQLSMRVKPKNTKMIYLTCETDKFKPNDSIPRENLVITVCRVSKDNISRKGLITFVEAAKKLPSLEFAIIGPHVDDSISYLSKIAPSNLKLTGYLPEDELIKWYQRAKVYCQLSYEEGEGAGGVLGEGMASGCVPVISEKAISLKETAKNSGIYIPYGDVEKTVEAISKALKLYPGMKNRVREEVLVFSREKRKKELIKAIYEIF